ncbi:7-keto-8-aminopelargonate synthetase-like enzyme [Sinorhizobium fredii]
MPERLSQPKVSDTVRYDRFFVDAIAQLHAEQRYRVFADLERIAGCFPRAIGHAPNGPREVVVWCSDDYLGMGQHPSVIGAMSETAKRLGRGAGRTRNISGTSHPWSSSKSSLLTFTARRRRWSSPPVMSQTRRASPRLRS